MRIRRLRLGLPRPPTILQRSVVLKTIAVPLIRALAAKTSDLRPKNFPAVESVSSRNPGAAGAALQENLSMIPRISACNADMAYSGSSIDLTMALAILTVTVAYLQWLTEEGALSSITRWKFCSPTHLLSCRAWRSPRADSTWKISIML